MISRKKIEATVPAGRRYRVVYEPRGRLRLLSITTPRTSLFLQSLIVEGEEQVVQEGFGVPLEVLSGHRLFVPASTINNPIILGIRNVERADCQLSIELELEHGGN